MLLGVSLEIRAIVSGPLRSAIWNWITQFPQEFNQAISKQRGLEGAPDRVFDCLYDRTATDHQEDIWPTLMLLNCISYERSAIHMQSQRTGMGHGDRTKKVIKKIGIVLDE